MHKPILPQTFALLAVSLLLVAGPASAAEANIVDFRLTRWTTAHFDAAETADAFVATLKKLGCEATKHAHNEHFDVKYRCLKWRRLSANSHSSAHRWERWLKARGFETHHEH